MKITARFSNMDEAENCARRLKHTCSGINSIRIRYRNQETIGDPPIEPVPMAFSNGDVGVNAQNGLTGAPYAALFALDRGEKDEHTDGPNGRYDCVMDVNADSMYGREVERIILNEHGRNLLMGD